MMSVRVEVNQECQVPGFGPGEAERLVEAAARAVLADQGIGSADLSITILDDGGMASLNREWKGRGDATDVLAFALYEGGEQPVGDVYLGAERAVEQGPAAGESAARELARLAIHATLHVLGWDHPEEDRESSEMWAVQERILTSLGVS